MRITARVRNSPREHHAIVRTDGREKAIAIPPKGDGGGSSISGGELLLLALATCYCNDLYREAAKRGLTLARVEVDVSGRFDTEGEPGRDITYRATVVADASEEEIRDLVWATDRVAEVHQTLRVETPVTLEGVEAISASSTAPSGS